MEEGAKNKKKLHHRNNVGEYAFALQGIDDVKYPLVGLSVGLRKKHGGVRPE